MIRFDTDRFREVADTLTRNRSRSLLTGFGIFWGIFMLLAMMGGGNGLKDLLSSNFQGFATNSGFVFNGTTTKPFKGFRKGRRWNLNLRDVEKLDTMVPELDVVTPLIGDWGLNITRGERKTQGFISGVRAEYSAVMEPRLRYGRYLNEIDVAQRRHVCVIGKKIYNDLFPEGGDPCGQMIQVRGSYFRVTGVDFNTGNVSVGGPADESIILPVSIVGSLLNRGNSIDLICVTAKPGYRMSDLEPRIREIVARDHYIDPTDKGAIRMMNAEEIFSIVDNLFKGVNILIWLIGLGTLLAGAIGVSNIMMVTVKERTTEIGIRRAIGATPRIILTQIMSESVALTLLAGVLGILFSVLALNMAELAATKDGILQAQFQIGFWPAIVILLLLTVLGLLAGLAPALRAMSIRPVDAMREE